MMNILKTFFPFFFQKEEVVKIPPKIVTAKISAKPVTKKTISYWKEYDGDYHTEKVKIGKTIKKRDGDLPTPPKKRGRPPKAKLVTAPKKRGRPPKVKE